MFRKAPLPQGISGRLYLHSMPGRFENWDDFASEADKQGLDAVASLVPYPEISEKSPAYAAALSGGGLSWQHNSFPISDFGVPPAGDTVAFRAFIAGLAGRLRQGESVLVHCGAGIGRTGTAAICLLVELGMPLAEAIEVIDRAGSRPESGAQWEFVRIFGGENGPAVESRSGPEE
jgi:hypothetical protein